MLIGFGGVATAVIARIDLSDVDSALAYLLPFGSVVAITVASLFYLDPPVTMLMARAAFGDKLKLTDAVGLAVVAVGILITQMPDRAVR